MSLATAIETHSALLTMEETLRQVARRASALTVAPACAEPPALGRSDHGVDRLIPVSQC
jgi:hypothetical protein